MIWSANWSGQVSKNIKNKTKKTTKNEKTKITNQHYIIAAMIANHITQYIHKTHCIFRKYAWAIFKNISSTQIKKRNL